MQKTQVPFLFWEDHTGTGKTRLFRYNYWTCALEPRSHNYRGHIATTTEHSRAHVPQQEKSLQWEAWVPWREFSPPRAVTREYLCSNKNPVQNKINKEKKKLKGVFKRNPQAAQPTQTNKKSSGGAYWVGNRTPSYLSIWTTVYGGLRPQYRKASQAGNKSTLTRKETLIHQTILHYELLSSHNKEMNTSHTLTVFTMNRPQTNCGSNPCPLQWKHKVLTTGPPGTP